MVQPLRIACIGAGHWGKNLVRNFHELGVLARVCEIDPHRRGELQAQYSGVSFTASFDDVLGDPEIAGVAIATPAESHGGLVGAALEAGKDVLVEKPLSLSVDEGKRLVRMASDRGRILMVGHLLWYHPAVLKLKELIDAGELGRIQYVYSNRLNLGRIRREENILWSFAPHDVSVILGLVGEMPQTLYAQGGNYLHDLIADVTVSVFAFPSGVRAHIFVSWLHPFKEQKLVVIGDRKMAVFDDVQPQDKLLLYPHTIDWRNNIPVATRAEGQPVAFVRTEPLRSECLAFLDSMRTRVPPRTDGEEGLRVLSVLEACQRSLEDGTKATPVPQAAVAAAAACFVHESSHVDAGAEIGAGTNIWHYCHISGGCQIGRDCRIGQNVFVARNVTIGDAVKIQNNVSVYEGVTLEDHVFCGPSTVFTNVYNPRSEVRRMEELRKTLVRRGATLGANCTVLCGVTVGEYAFVGAGAVVLEDVPDFALVVGNPSRVVGWMCSCGNRIEFDGDEEPVPGSCRECKRRYEKADGRVRPA